jgi:hypothetical protein
MLRRAAISFVARDTVCHSVADPRFRVHRFGCAIENDDIAHRPCTDVSRLLLDPVYQAADAAIFHFGMGTLAGRTGLRVPDILLNVAKCGRSVPSPAGAE